MPPPSVRGDPPKGGRHVRHLASGQQLLWLPVAAATADEAVAALQMLFTIYGAPLVLKMDIGSPFVATATQALLAVWEVIPLFSPPGWPAYHGAIEVGIGALKARTHAQAACQGHPAVWMCADLEAARQAANALARPLGAHGPTPAQLWSQRRPLGAAERAAFQARVVAREPASQPLRAAAASEPPAASANAVPVPPRGGVRADPAEPEQAQGPARRSGKTPSVRPPTSRRRPRAPCRTPRPSDGTRSAGRS